MRNLIIFLLFFNNISSQNLVTREIFGNRNAKGWNTFIGGVSSTISTSALLATKLGISNNRIRNFVVVGIDIKCRIIGGYAMANWGGFYMTYYTDSDNLVNTIPYRCLDGVTPIETLELNGVTSIQGEIERESSIKRWILPQLTTVADGSWGNMFGKPVFIYAPRIANLGTTIGNTNVLENWSGTTFKIYTNPILATINGGNPDGDLIGLRTGSDVRYVANFTPPNPVTSLATGTITTTSIQFNFTDPTGSTNAYDFSEIYKKDINGNWLYISEIASGGIVSGLTTSTTYNFKIVARDIFYNGAESFITATTL